MRRILPQETATEGSLGSLLVNNYALYALRFNLGITIYDNSPDGIPVIFTDGSVEFVEDDSQMNLSDPDRNSTSSASEINAIWERIEEKTGRGD